MLRAIEGFGGITGSRDRLPSAEVSASIRTITKFVSLKYGFIYLPVPKSGATTLLKMLERMHPGGDVDRLRINKGLDQIFEEHPGLRGYPRFSVVRHPFTRMVSCYIDKILAVNDDKQKMLAKAGLTELPSSFEEFVEFVCSERGRDQFANSHWAAQTAILCDTDRRVAVDLVGRLEDMHENLSAIFAALNMQLPVFYKHRNHRGLHAAGMPGALTQDESYWTREIERRLMERFRLDYEVFGYRPFGPVADTQA